MGWGTGLSLNLPTPPTPADELWPDTEPGIEPTTNVPDIAIPDELRQLSIAQLATQITAGRRAFASLVVKGVPRTEAYLQAFPKCRSARNAAIEGRRVLKMPMVVAYMAALANAVKDLADYTDKELKRGIARLAFADMRTIYKPDGTLLAPKDWPDDIAFAIQEIHEDVVYEGRGHLGAVLKRRIKLGPRLEAQRTLAQMDGKLAPPQKGGGDGQRATFVFKFGGAPGGGKTIKGKAKRVIEHDEESDT